MRLIDAEKLVEITERDFCYPEAYKKLVDEQPTAYDIENVMKELESYVRSDICKSCGKCRYTDAGDINCETCGALGALEIVRRGGAYV